MKRKGASLLTFQRRSVDSETVWGCKRQETEWRNHQPDKNFSIKVTSSTVDYCRKFHIIRMIKVKQRERVLTKENSLDLQELFCYCCMFYYHLQSGRRSLRGYLKHDKQRKKQDFYLIILLPFIYWTQIHTNKYQSISIFTS